MSVHFASPTKKNHFGIEVAQVLRWDQWEPGGEYTQLITLKNINTKTKKLKYRIPNTNFFTTRYPQPIVLSSGMSINVPITFRPLKKDKYEDVIEFVTKDGQFNVPMKAVLPDASLNFPEMIKFGMCAVKDQLSIPFQINNTSDLQITFQLKATHPFILTPISGTLAPKTHCGITAFFKPEAAFVYELDAECIFGTNESQEKISKIIKLEGIGKYIHLGIRYSSQSGHNVVVDYGQVSLGKKVEKTVEIKNFSPVDAPFQIIQKTNLSLDNVFSCSKYHGIIPPESSTNIKLTFQPELHNITYVDNLEVLAVGMASKSSIKCLGVALGPDMVIETSSINFGMTKPFTEVTRSFKVSNRSDMDAVFQFKINCNNSIFKLSMTSGRIEAKSTKTVVAKFVPTKAIVCYRKVFCLIQNQEPVTLEMFGTCCTDEIKPVVLTRQHLQNNEIYTQRGLSRLSPEEITELLKDEKICMDENNLLEVVDKEVNDKLEKPSRKLTPYEEYFCHCVEDTSRGVESCLVPNISIDLETIDFGKCKEDTVIQKTVNVSNNTFGKVTCVWMNGDNKFQISPEEADIDAMSTASFRIIFRPDEVSKYFNAEMEAFIFYKSMRDHRLIDERVVFPPWFVTVNVIGHTFPRQKESFLPVCKWDSTNMVFPPISSLVESVYRTCLLTNQGETPIHYSFEEDETKVFSCKPHNALTIDRYHLIVFKMNAMEYGTNKRNIKCSINNTEKFSEQFEVTMTAEQPDVTMSPKDILYFKPTCVGNISNQTVTLKNCSRVPLRCQWKISRVDESIVQVNPRECVILSNEVQNHTWTFTPGSKMKHLFKAKLIVSTMDSSVEVIQRKYVLRLIGEGQVGDIHCKDSAVDFGEISVGDYTKKSVVIWNNSSCSLHYKLCVDHRVTSPDDLEELPQEDTVIKLDHYEFLLPSKASKSIYVIMAPKRRADYDCKISYKLSAQDVSEENNDEVLKDLLNTKRPLFTVKGKGVYPQLQVNDVRGAGCAEQYSKKFLWELLHLDNLNTMLQMEPSSGELKYEICSRHSTRRRMPNTTKAVNEINFSSAVYGSEPCFVYINIQNTGASRTEWAIKYPTDFKLEMEYWAETGDLADDELHEMYVMNSELFVVTPRSGRLNAGESQTVALIYNHTSLGTHKLPVLLKIVQGREVRLNFVGTTLEAHQNTLHFTSFAHYFSPVSIGAKSPPFQSYTLHNGSGKTTRFAFDTSVLDLVEKDNYDHRIFECLTPEGEVAPYQSVEVLWLFSPIEARSYSVGVPLMIENNESVVISFNGAGYDPVLMGETMKFVNDDITLPSRQLVKAPNQLLKISSEFLQFGHISLYSETSQLIFLTNTSTEHTVSFHWIIKGTHAESYFNISPSSGFLKPQENTMCKVTIFSQGPPAVHDFDIRCEVIDETLIAQFKCDLKAWSKRREEKKHLFTIRDVPENKLKNNRPGSTTSKRLVAISNTRSDNDLKKKYEALPPIKPNKTDKSRERCVIVEERPSTQDDIKPLPPQSFVSHLGVHVTTHSTEEYNKLAPQNLTSMFVQRNPTVDIFCNPTKRSQASSSEMNVVETLLKMLLKELIHDKDFQDSIDDLENEPVPLYAMLTPDLPILQDGPSRFNIGNNVSEEGIGENITNGREGITTYREGITTYREGIATNHEAIVTDREEITTDREEIATDREEIASNDGEGITDDREGITNDREGNTNDREEITTDRKEIVNDREERVVPIERFSSNDLAALNCLEQRQNLKRNDEMRYLLNEILESTISNILAEANLGEFSLTNRPRLIAPRSSRAEKEDTP